MLQKTVAIIGAGPAGLTAAYLLTKKGVPVTVIEADPVYVGGISKTVKYKGFHFDIGGHRFFSKSKEVEDFWTEILPDDMLIRPRLSRIYYNGKFFSYPLKPIEALFKLGIIKSILCVFSYFKYKMFPIPNPKNFEDWVTNQFGKRLFNVFFKTYTEKVWGMSCKEISADWAAQRIKGLSLSSAILSALRPKPKSREQMIKTLIDSFRYPRKGPGMMWEACAEKVKSQGGKIFMGKKVIGCTYETKSELWTITYQDKSGKISTTQAGHLISSAAMRELADSLTPKLSAETLKSAHSLKYRDFVTVAIILKDKNLFDDNWIYIHDPRVKVGRVQNFKSWSPELIPNPDQCCFGLEYFCFEGDGVWNSPDSELIKLAQTELQAIGLAQKNDFIDGCVVRQAKAYPVYDENYLTHVETLRKELEKKFPTLHLVGRNGMHKYNNQDHAMMTAMLCVENILAGKKVYNLWQVNQDAEYHESGNAGEQNIMNDAGRIVPKKVKEDDLPKAA